jgi:hypothetical protein
VRIANSVIGAGWSESDALNSCSVPGWPGWRVMTGDSQTRRSGFEGGVLVAGRGGGRFRVGASVGGGRPR